GSSYLVRYSLFLAAATLLCSLLHARRRYDLVQVHSLPDVLVFAAVIPKLFGAQVVLDLHEMMVEFFCAKFQVRPDGLRARFVAAAEQASIRFADFAFTCTNEMREAFIARGADPEKLGVVLNASEEDVFDVEHYPPRGRSDGEFVLICHGSVEERYGIDTAIRAVGLVRDEIPRLRMEVYGSGSYVEEGRRLTRELGVEDRVRFSDAWVPMPELLEAIADADAGVVAIKQDPFRDLTHCNKMYDLVTMRRPVLITRTRSVQAYFDETCFEYFDSDDASELAAGIRRLYEKPEHGEALVARATEALEPYRWPRQREIYQSYIERLLEPSEGGAAAA
nr:glycosyltransferase [Actinomycetota bacterium]